jgi:uncharacterized protein YacL
MELSTIKMFIRILFGFYGIVVALLLANRYVIKYPLPEYFRILLIVFMIFFIFSYFKLRMEAKKYWERNKENEIEAKNKED